MRLLRPAIIASCTQRMANRNRVPNLKRTVAAPPPVRGQSPDMALQEAWALLLIHNITATATARAAGTAGIDPAHHPVHAVSHHPAMSPRRGRAASTAGTAR